MVKKVDFSKSDGSGRTLREQQQQALDWLTKEWNNSEVFAIVAPPGIGKTLISRAIQIATDAAVITPSNVLVSQYKESYPEVNMFYGADHYEHDSNYQLAKLCTALPSQHSVYNPMSFKVAKREHQFVMPDVVILDEADAMLSMFQALVSQVYFVNRAERYKMSLDSSANLVEWLRQTMVEHTINLQNICNGRSQKKRQLETKIAKLEELIEALIEEPQSYALSYVDKQTARGTRHYLHISPTRVPVSFLKRFFKNSKLILLSATLLPADVRELSAGRSYKILELDSCIPAERRRLYICPTKETLSYPTPYQALAEKLDEVLDKVQIRPCLVHLTYKNMLNVSPYLKNKHFTHTPETKRATLDQWQAEGGIMLAGGCSEGISLDDDLCRLQIITTIQYPNIGSDFVQKKMAQNEGRAWYNLAALRHLVQAAGRSSRNPKDFSVIICLDSRISKLLLETKEQVPKFFKESICYFSTSYEKIMDTYNNFLKEV